MKRLFALLMIAVTAAVFAACGGGTEATVPEVTDAPTEQPYIATPVDEPEWTYADGELKLEDGSFLYADGEDFLYFAIVGADKESMELRFMLSDSAAGMIKKEGSGGPYYISFNGEMIGTATLSDDCKVAVVTAKDANGDITELATLIRGVG